MRWMGIHKFNVIEALEYRGLLLEPMGNKFHVNGNTGSDGYSGKSEKNPMKTILAALAKCVDYHNDYIIVHDHYQETFPITVDKASVHIIGMGPYNVGLPMVWLTASLDTAIFNIEADYVEISGFEFGSGASHAAIEFTASKGYGLIRNNCFGLMQTGQDGIRDVAPFDATAEIIEQNQFGSGLTRDGVRIDHNMTRSIIRDNTFRAVTGVGINVPGQMALGQILRNKFMLPSNTHGKAITLSAAVAGVFVEDNDANFGDQAACNTIPWVVTGGAADANCFDNNKNGGVVIFPA